MTGAFIASQLPHPAVYVPLTLAAHFLEDWIPHWDVGTGLSNGHRKRQTAFWLELIDLFMAVGVVWVVWQLNQPVLQTHIWLGAVVGIAPDVMGAPKNFLKWEPRFLKPFNKFHNTFHHSTPHVLIGLLPQVITILTILALTFV